MVLALLIVGYHFVKHLCLSQLSCWLEIAGVWDKKLMSCVTYKLLLTKQGAKPTQKFTRCNHLRLICSKCILGWHTHKPVLRTRATGLQPLPWLLLKPSFLTTLAALGALQLNCDMEWAVAKANHFGCIRCSASKLCYGMNLSKG